MFRRSQASVLTSIGSASSYRCRCPTCRRSSMKADLQQQWQQARQQWQSNPRLRLLAGVVVLILIVSVLQGLHQTQVEARQQARQQWQRLQDVRQLSQESHWHDYAE